jgi:ankyrin repeat protein
MGWQPIHIAIMHGKQDIVELCLGLGGVSVNSRTNYLTTPLMTACEHRKVQLVKYLLDQGADVNATNDLGVVALFYATDRSSQQDSLAMMRLLLERGASTSIVDVWRRTVRHACKGDKDKLRLLD